MTNSKICTVLIVAIFFWACETTILVEPEEIPSTENGVLADDNRFFFIGDNALYELLTQPDGRHRYEVVTKRDDCVFSGLTADGTKLYATCIAISQNISTGSALNVALVLWSDIVRVDLSKDVSDPARIATARLEGRYFYPNGMAVDDSGDIYISNSYSVVGALFFFKIDPAILRVRVVDEEGFQIEKKAVVPMAQGGLTPNGVQIKGDDLWFVSGSELYHAKIEDDGLSPPTSVYAAPSSRVFDDFTILPNNILAIAEIPMPFSLESILKPNSWPPADEPSQITYVSISPFEGAREVVYEYEMAHPITPSSVTFVTDRAGPAIYITDYFFGGLYRVGPAPN
jgi:hypothetical protein